MMTREMAILLLESRKAESEAEAEAVRLAVRALEIQIVYREKAMEILRALIMEGD